MPSKIFKITHSKPFVDSKDIKAVAIQVRSSMHAAGSKTKEFEEKLAKFIGVKYAKAVNSGTNALHLALLALNIKEGDEVILPSYVCASVLSAVHYTRAKPVFADIDPDFDNKGYNISVKTIKALINNKTKAIIVPHMFGFPCEIDQIIALRVHIIEDCAHSIGASYKGKLVGSFGKISIFSFYATKMLSTGYGGMISTSNNEIWKKVEDLTKYDERENYNISYNYSLGDIQSALGTEQLKKLSIFIDRRIMIEKKYNDVFKNKLKIPPKADGSFAFRYVVRFPSQEKRDNAKEKLLQRGIRTVTPIFKPLHHYFNLSKEKFPNTEEAHNTSLSIPCYPALTDEEVNYIIKSVKESI